MKRSARPGVARSLRLKLSLRFLAISTLLHALLLIAVVSLRGDLVRRSNESRIASQAHTMVDNILVEKPEWDGRKLRQLVPSDARFEFILVRRESNAETLASWRVPDPKTVPFTPVESVPAGPRGAVFSTITQPFSNELVPDADTIELVTLPFRNREGDYYLQVGVRPGELESALRPFLDLFLLGIPLASLAALAAAWFISGRAVEPLLRLSRAARDVSPSRLGERIVLETPEKEVTDLQDELNQALERLEAGYRSQEEFISNVSHELKTPIAVLRSQSQLLAEGSHSPEAHRNFVASVEEETKRLGRMVESFLSLARHGWARSLTETTQVPIIDIVLDAVRHASPLAEGHGVRLSARLQDPDDESPIVAGDPALLETMLENLLRNAIRFSPPGGTVHVEAQSSESDVTLQVRDEGPGIPADMLERVFERFVGYEDPRGGRGAGIGLTMAKNVAELHRGRIEARNTQQGGALFSVQLPRA